MRTCDFECTRLHMKVYSSFREIASAHPCPWSDAGVPMVEGSRRQKVTYVSASVLKGCVIPRARNPTTL